VWGIVHGGALLLGTVAGLIGFVTGLMYLWHAALLRRKLPPRAGFQLPNLEWLQKANERAILVTALLVLCGFLSGLALSWLKHQAIYWSDPVVWTTSLLAVWMAVAATFNLVYRPARQGRKVAYLTLATFVFLAISLAGLLLGTEHARPDQKPGRSAAAHRSGPFAAAREGGGR
jgi:CDP-diglyceride synthetase